MSQGMLYRDISKDSMSILSRVKNHRVTMRENRHTIFWLITTVAPMCESSSYVLELYRDITKDSISILSRARFLTLSMLQRDCSRQKSLFEVNSVIQNQLSYFSNIYFGRGGCLLVPKLWGFWSVGAHLDQLHRCGSASSRMELIRFPIQRLKYQRK